jgi:arsenate reductase
MAEGWTRHLGGDRVDVLSGGTQPAPEVHPLAIQVMDEMGIDISSQRPKDVDVFVGQTFHYIITTCDHAKEHCPFFPGNAKRDHWGIVDPADATGTDGERLEAFRSARGETRERVRKLMEAIPE